MKTKIFTLLCLSAFAVANVQAQAFSTFELEGVTMASKIAGASTQTTEEMDESNLGTVTVICTADADLSNSTAVVTYTTSSAPTTYPEVLPTDWTETQYVRLFRSNKYRWYAVDCYKMQAATLPYTLDTQLDEGNFVDTWSKETIGWAYSGLTTDQKMVRFGSTGATFILAFSEEADSIFYNINSVTNSDGTILDVEESADGMNWTTLIQYTENNLAESTATAEEKAQALELLSTTRYVRFQYTNRNSSNISLTGDLTVTKAEDDSTTEPDEPAVVESAARINGFEIEGATAMGPFVQLTPTNNDESVPGTIHVIYTPDVDLTDVTPTLTLSSSTTSVVGDMPTDWSNTQNIQVANSEYASWYNVTCKNIIPAALPMTIDLSAGEDNSSFALSWTPETEGWAGACMRENSGDQVRFGTQGAHFIVAFTDEPDSIYYSINYGATTVAEGTVVDVEESKDGETWTSLVQFTDTTIPDSKADSIKAQQHKLLSDTRYVRWMFTTRAEGTVSLTGSVAVTKVDDSSGMANTTNAVEVKLSPVPAVDVLNIAAPQAVASVAICNIAGQTVASYSNVGTQVSVSNLASGSYLAIVTLADGTKTVKSFIKK